MKRLPSTICHICLRSGLKLMQVDYKLESYYADLCDYVDIPRVHFCGECIKRLKNGYQLKNICVTAVKTLMTWARQKPSKTQPLNLLYKELHSYQYLGLSNKKNFKIHVGNRRFKCDICGKGFLHNVSLRDHINGVHYNIKKKRNRKTSQE